MLRHTRNANNKTIFVGIAKKKIHVDRKTGEIVDTASIYKIHEEGEGHVPKRPTLRPAASKFNYGRHAKGIVLGTVDGSYIDDLTTAGDDFAKTVKKEIMSIKSPALKPFTIRERVNAGTTNPLVDTGQLLGQIGHRVE